MLRKNACNPNIEDNLPKNSAFDGKNSPFDGKNSPFDGKNSPFDGKNSPFDGKNSAFCEKNKCKCIYCLNIFSSSRYKNKHELICRHNNETRILEIEMEIEPELPECNTECRFCNKKLFRSDALYKHIPICKEREIYHKQLLKQKEKNTFIGQQIINNNNQVTNNNNQTLNIYFNENTIPFGSKRLTDHITTEKLVEILRSSYKQYEKEQDYEIAGEILLRLEECLQEVPENRNYLIDEKSSIWSIKTDNGFKYIDKDKCMHSIVKENAGILCDKKEEINICNEQVLKNKTIADAFIHEKQFRKKGLHYSPYGERKVNKIKNGLQIVNKNNECPF